MKPAMLRKIKVNAKRADRNSLVILYMEVFGAEAHFETERIRASIIEACDELLEKTGAKA